MWINRIAVISSSIQAGSRRLAEVWASSVAPGQLGFPGTIGGGIVRSTLDHRCGSGSYRWFEMRPKDALPLGGPS
jgi:hypothetical protein